MSSLLERDPYTRIGASSWSSFTEHPFFSALDFRLLENKRCSPVFQPSQDKSNFDAVYELEELLLEQAPLEGRARKAAKKQHQQQQQQHSGLPPLSDPSELRRSKKELKRRARSDEEDKEEEILEMINQYFEPYDYTKYFSFNIDVDIRHENNPQSLATLTNEIRRLSLVDAATPGSTPPARSYIPDTPSQRSTGHDSSRSIPPMPPIPDSYLSGSSPSPTSDTDYAYPRYPTPPPQQPPHPSPSSPQSSYPLTIRPPDAVARIIGREKKKSNANSPTSSYSPTSGGGTYMQPPPTSHPTSPPKDSKAGIMLWGKRDKDTRSAEKWESGVIGRERARVIIDVGGKRCYQT